MKNLISFLLCVAVGILGTLGYQHFFCCEQPVVPATETIAVDSALADSVIAVDTIRKDSIK